MAIYFKDPYKKYHDELGGATNLVSSGDNMVTNAGSLVKIGDKLQSQLESSIWEELGYEQLVTLTIPALKQRFQTFSTNTTYLQLACSEAINALLPLTVTLKEKDELLEQKIKELESLVEPSPMYETDAKGKETGEKTQAYKEYEETKSRLEQEIATLKSELEQLIVDIDAKVNAIKALSGSMANFDVVNASNTTEIAGLELTEAEEELIEAVEQAVAKEVEDGTYEELTGGITYNGETILYNDVGGVEEGYSRKLLTSHGKMVTVFQQFWCDSIKFSDSDNTLKNAGCGFNALASILSSKYPDITPEKVFTDMGRKFMYPANIVNYCNKYGIKVGSREEVSRYDYAAYKAHLVEEVMKGNMVMTTVNARNDNKYTNNSHWVAIVDYDPERDEFYVTDSADNRDYNAAPIEADRFLKVYSVNTNVVYIADDSNYAKYNKG